MQTIQLHIVMKIMYIGLLSDTHGVFSPAFRDFFEPVDEIWHAGDFGGGLDTAAEIAAFKPLRGVCGNADNFELRYDYPLFQAFECEGLKVLMTHIGGYPGRYDANARRLIREYHPGLFVCGHSHILRVMNDPTYKMLVMNPGAAGLQGFHLVRTALRFRVTSGHISELEVFELPK